VRPPHDPRRPQMTRPRTPKTALPAFRGAGSWRRREGEIRALSVETLGGRTVFPRTRVLGNVFGGEGYCTPPGCLELGQGERC
jgi:hypothetical protein